MKLRHVLCIMTLYSHNMKVIHWNSTGHRFDKIHDLADKYHAMIQGSVDTIAEMMGMLDIKPPSFVDLFKELAEFKEDLINADGNALYTYEDGVLLVTKMLDSIVSALTELHDEDEVDDNIGIKSIIEAMIYEYDKEKSYFNKRRSE